MNANDFFDITKLAAYKENHKIEVKSAKGGLPGSLWETYSAFANTEGGVILLGVNERKDGTFVVEGVENPAKMTKDFWNMVNNRQKVSINILTNSMVTVEEVDNKDIVVIHVPRAERTTKPVYVGMDPKTGSYRRNGEGDYRCSIDEVSLMIRDASVISEDNKILNGYDFSAFNRDTVKRYRQLFKLHHENHIWNNEEDEIFMRRIGALREDHDSGKFYATGAGLLMFGNEYEIISEFPAYFLDYQENRNQSIYTRWTDRVTSQSGEWSGNVLDFILMVIPKLQAELKVPFVLRGNQRDEDTPLHKVIREAMVNMLSNADFYGRRGVVVHKKANGFSFANPGSMRVSATDAIESNISDPRNELMLRMLSLIRFGERAGSGLHGIFKIWNAVYHIKPRIETFSDGVDRTTLYLDTEGKAPDIRAMLKLYDNPDGIVFAQVSKQETGQENSKSEQERLVGGQETPPESVSKTSFTVYQLIKSTPEITTQKMMRKTGLSKTTIQNAIKSLKLAGFIERIGPTKGGKWVVKK